MYFEYQQGSGLSESNERITIAVFGFHEESLNKIKVNNDYSFKGFIQISGKATGKVIKDFHKEKEIFSVEVASNDTIPMGLYWKLEDSIQ